MKMISVLMLVVILASMTLGCVSTTPTATPAPTVTPSAPQVPTIWPTTAPSSLPTSQVFMPDQTTNGRTYPNATVTAIANGSQPGGQAGGELGNQH